MSIYFTYLLGVSVMCCGVIADACQISPRPQPKSSLQRFIERLPKVNLHVHLEGAIEPHTVLELAKRNQIKLPATTEKELQELFTFRDFNHFITIYSLITSCLKTADDYELIAYEFGNYCHTQNIRYAEVTFTIETNMKLSGLSWQTILDGLNRGRMRAKQDFGVTWQWVFDIIRDNYATQQTTLDIVKQAHAEDAGVVALGLTGHEDAAPAEQFLKTFADAQAHNVRSTIHAGELTGPLSIISALHVLHANRIGHGVRAIEDKQLVSELRKNKIPLEICPTSNIRLGIYPNYESHPLRKLWNSGLMITINDDDPALLNTTLNKEYALLAHHFGFTEEELMQVSINGIKASFLSPEQKKEFETQFRKEFENL